MSVHHHPTTAVTTTPATRVDSAKTAVADESEWLELFDPQSSRVVYANTATGQCSWTRPNTQITARNPDGEWWELVDEETCVPYYYNSTTGATEWESPEDAVVVPFHALLSTSVGKRLSLIVSNRGSMAFTCESTDSLVRKASRASLRSNEGGRLSRKSSLANTSGSRHASKFSNHSLTQILNTSAVLSEPAAITDTNTNTWNIHGNAPSALTNIAEEVSSIASPANDTDTKSAPLPAASNKRQSQSESALENLREVMESEGSKEQEEDGRRDNSGETAAPQHINTKYLDNHIDYTVPASATVEYFRNLELPLTPQNIHQTPSKQRHCNDIFQSDGTPTTTNSERMSTLEHHHTRDTINSVMMHSNRNRSMPTIRADSKSYGIRVFASTQFAAQKRGFLRRKVPLDEMVSYTSEPLTRPLLNLPREATRDAVRCFGSVCRFMSSSDQPPPADKEINGDILWLANRGIANQYLRDEIFCQLAKQITGNPSPACAENGWGLVGILLYAIYPSPILLPHMAAFVDTAHIPTETLKRFLKLQLNRAKRTNSRSAKMSRGELRLAMDVVKRPLHIFGCTLSEIMQEPRLINSKTGLPLVLEHLIDLIRSLGGLNTEGLFRIPGDADMVRMSRLRIEAWKFDYSHIQDPHVPASLLKEWLRDLAEPLIPGFLYDKCMSDPGDAGSVLEILSVLPPSSLRVINYLLGFLCQLLQPNVVAKTKMDASNLALVFGPSFLHNPVTDLKNVFAKSSAEQTFVQTLIATFIDSSGSLEVFK